MVSNSDCERNINHHRTQSTIFHHVRYTLVRHSSNFKTQEAPREIEPKGYGTDWVTWLSAINPDYPTHIRLQALRTALDHGLQDRTEVALFMTAFGKFLRALGLPDPIDERKQVLRTYNAFMSRLGALNIKPRPRPLSYALFLSAYARSTQSLWHYAQMAKDSGSNLTTNLSRATIREISKWCTNPKEFLDWNGLRKKDELRLLLTSRNPQLPGHEDTRNNNFRNLFNAMDPQHNKHLFMSIGSISGPEDLRQTWSETLEKMAPYEKIESAQDFKIMANHFIQALAMTGGPREAWETVRELQWHTDSFFEETWIVLLDHPEFITQWKPGMEGLVLRKYISLLEKAEEILGVEWSGGEDGSHVFLDSDLKDEFNDVASQ